MTNPRFAGQSPDPVDRAHLTGRTRPSPPIHRYPPAPALGQLVTRYWFPVWSVTEPTAQSTLQHPVCLIVVSNTYARFYGVTRGLSTVVLEGDGWAAGVMLTPAAGHLLLGAAVSEVTDTHRDLSDLAPADPLLRWDPTGLVATIREAMRANPQDPEAHRAVIAAYESRLAAALPVDVDGVLVNRIVAWLDARPDVTRVSEVAEEFGLGERALQRLVRARIGLSPKWLIQRRRLHEAVVGLKAGNTTLAELAAELGYSDQAHFTTDFRAVTGMTPGDYLADQR